MIIWINGTFGSGKTSTAEELHKRIPHSYIYDPENVGFFIRDNLPPIVELNDFQDHKLWRDFNSKMLFEISQSYNGVIIVPMTIVNEIYYEEIINSVVEQGILVKHFTLITSKSTTFDRLMKRGEDEHSWPAKQFERCHEGLKNSVFHEHLITDHLSVDEIVEHVLFQISEHLD